MKEFKYVVTDNEGIEGADEEAAYEAVSKFMQENL